MRVAAIAAALVAAVTLAASYFAPRFSTALAGAPVIGTLTAPVLQAIGLSNVSGHVTALSGTSSSSGFAVSLEGGYADGVRTVLLMKVAPAGSAIVVNAPPGVVTLTDQFGGQYQPTNGYADASTGQVALAFTPISGPAGVLGARLTLHITQLTAVGGAAVSGDWHLSGTILVDESRPLAPPADGLLGSATVRFTGGIASPNTAELRFTVDGLPAGGSGTKNPTFGVVVTDPTGNAVVQLSEDIQEGQVAVTWVVSRPGLYRVAISDSGLGTLVRSVDLSP